MIEQPTTIAPRFRLAMAAAFALAAVFGGATARAQDLPLPPGAAQGEAAPLQIAWEVKNRFRLFADERDFARHAEAMRAGSVLAAEQTLAVATDGRGWARDTLARLCIDAMGRLVEQCLRDGAREHYLAPSDHRVGIRVVAGAAAGMSCVWIFDDGDEKSRTMTADCAAEVPIRVRHGRTTLVLVEATGPDGTTRRGNTDIAVRDLLIAGLGDSIAAGEGNPDRAVTLSDDGFCFRQLGSLRIEYYRPGRVGYTGNKACDNTPTSAAAMSASTDAALWDKLSARWMSAPCHRSLYSYQLRAALALAVETPHAAVTFLPLACTGATIAKGILAGQSAREIVCGEIICPEAVPAQIEQLKGVLGAARKRDAERALDLVFLTVGANDIDFSGLVADVIIEARPERVLFGRTGLISSVEDAQQALTKGLPRDFARLRAALKPLVGGKLEKVVYVTYGHPALAATGGACRGGRDGFDVHPAFGADGERLRKVAEFVQNRFLPGVKALATCGEGVTCASPADRMTFADAHQAAFADHGVCARAPSDPVFDRECFSPTGESFEQSPAEGSTAPLKCDRLASEYRAYAPRARWVRTANDSYFAAMTFPRSSAAGHQPSDIHDATWGILSAVYGGAIHPTAEGHGAMADAALAQARRVLGLSAPPSVIAKPLPAPSPTPVSEPR